MLVSEIKKLNKKVRVADISKMSGISSVRIYEINNNPDKKTIKLDTVEKIYYATKALCGVGLTPDKYLYNVKLPFKNNKE